MWAGQETWRAEGPHVVAASKIFGTMSSSEGRKAKTSARDFRRQRHQLPDSSPWPDECAYGVNLLARTRPPGEGRNAAKGQTRTGVWLGFV